MEGKKILVVEDDPAIRDLIVSWLDQEGYPVSGAMNGLDALQTIAVDKPALILVDLMMPLMDGRTFIRTLKQNTANKAVPVIVISADTHARDTIEELNVNAIIPKPFDLDDVTEIVARYTSQSLAS